MSRPTTRTAGPVAAGSSSPAATRRLPRLDALRGLAIVWMAGFHFCFDLVYFGFIHQNFYTDPFWTIQRSCIVSVFLLCAGIGQAIATEAVVPGLAGTGGGPGGFGNGRDAAARSSRGRGIADRMDARFLRRWAQIAGCAVAVSLGSWLMFPRSFISFGVLHFMAVALLLLRATLPAGRVLWWAAVAFALAPQLLASRWFDHRATNWIGLVTEKPIAEDYVPLLPWLAVVCVGLAVGQWLLRHRPGWLAGSLPAGLNPLATLGRWSLTFYMLHQPVFIGLLAALAWGRRS